MWPVTLENGMEGIDEVLLFDPNRAIAGAECCETLADIGTELSWPRPYSALDPVRTRGPGEISYRGERPGHGTRV